MGEERSTSFGDFVTQKEQEATPERRAQMKDAQHRMELLHAEHFGIAAQVTNLRKRLHLTQADLSEKTGIKQPEISRIEQGNANPTQETLVKLGIGLGAVLAFVPADQIESFV